jgi:hypothetical protein
MIIQIFYFMNDTENRDGGEVSIKAAIPADAMLEKGDLDRYGLWKRILCGRWRNCRGRGACGAGPVTDSSCGPAFVSVC